MLQNATPLRKSAPGPPKSSDEHVSCTAPGTEMHLCRSSSNVPRLPSFLEMPQDRHPIDQVRQFPAEKVIPYLRQKIPISLFFPYLIS